MVAERDIEVGEVLFHEDPIVWYPNPEEDTTMESCHHCFSYIESGAILACPTCSHVRENMFHK